MLRRKKGSAVYIATQALAEQRPSDFFPVPNQYDKHMEWRISHAEYTRSNPLFCQLVQATVATSWLKHAHARYNPHHILALNTAAMGRAVGPGPYPAIHARQDAAAVAPRGGMAAEQRPKPRPTAHSGVSTAASSSKGDAAAAALAGGARRGRAGRTSSLMRRAGESTCSNMANFWWW